MNILNASPETINAATQKTTQNPALTPLTLPMGFKDVVPLIKKPQLAHLCHLCIYVLMTYCSQSDKFGHYDTTMDMD